MEENYELALLEGRDLKLAAEKGEPTLYREDAIEKALRSLQQRRCVLIVGAPGVGKSSVLRGIAQRMPHGIHQKVVQFAIAQLFSGTRYLGEWQTKVASIVGNAKQDRVVLCFSDIWNLSMAGATSNRDDTAWDAIRPSVESGELQLLGEVSEEQLLAMHARPGFVTLFDTVRIAPLTPEQVREIVIRTATALGLDVDAALVSRLFELCDRFLPAAGGPGPALTLVDQVAQYRNEKRRIGEDEPLTPAFVEKVFSIYSGLPPFIVCREQVRPLAEIRDWFRARIVGQTHAIDAVVQTLALYKAGLHDPSRPIGAFLFVGPTGVGKTELARALAVYLFGSEKRLLRFDLSEFKDYHSFELLIGDPRKPQSPARLIDPLRAQPFQVVLLDELEKAHGNVWDLLLQVLDDGRLTPPGGPTVSFRNAIIIATSNVGAGEMSRRTIGFSDGAVAGVDAQVQKALESEFRPEFLNRFQHVVPFLPLRPDEVRAIAQAELQRVLEREGIVARRLIVDVDDAVLDLVVARGYDERYGARALKRCVQQLVVMPIAALLLESRVFEGSIIRLTARQGEVQVNVLDTEESRARREAEAPVRVRDGRTFDRKSLREFHGQLHDSVERLGRALELDTLKSTLAELEQLREGAELWRDPRAAAGVLDRYDRTKRTIARLVGLQRVDSELADTLASDAATGPLANAGDRLVRFERTIADAQRELLHLGEGGHGNAIVEVRPIGRSRPARDLLFHTYRAWAESRGYLVRMILEPMIDSESVIFAVSGPYAYGYLRLEAGMHRLREGDDAHVVRVRVVAWDDDVGTAELGAQRALKQRGQLNGRVRSRVELAGSDLVIQNEGTLSENRTLAEALAPSWRRAEQPVETIVRRYESSPARIRDVLTGTSSGRADALRPSGFHSLLCLRIDVHAANP